MAAGNPTPNLQWYTAIAERKHLDTTRCPFASVDRCPRYYQSLSLLGDAGATRIDPKVDARLLLRRSADPRIAFTIVGVVGDVRSTALNQESPALYYPMARQVWPLMDIVVRTDGAPEALVPVIRQKVHELDSELALGNVRTMEQWLSNTAAQPRLNTVLLGAFASVALLIASIGIYGVLAYSVSQRTGEIGVRMALGATPRGVLRLIVGEGMKVVVIGIGTGVVAGLTLGRTVSSLIFGVPVRDPATFTAVAVALAGVALAACVIPALRASRVDPIVALRND